MFPLYDISELHAHGTILKTLRREIGVVSMATLHKQPLARTLCCVVFTYTDFTLCKILLGSCSNLEEARFLRRNRVCYCTFTEVSEDCCGSMSQQERKIQSARHCRSVRLAVLTL